MDWASFKGWPVTARKADLIADFKLEPLCLLNVARIFKHCHECRCAVQWHEHDGGEFGEIEG